MTPHLSHEQLCDIVLARSPHPLSSDFAALQEHLGICPACATELSNLRTSLSIFRDASASFAQQELLRLRTGNRVESRSVHSLRSTALQPIYWAAAAAALLVAAVLPLSLHRQSPPSSPSTPAVTAPAHTTESDEALLNDINQTLSASIPSPMQPLADPTASAAATTSTSPQRKN
jgi:hypothetical protein